MSLTTYRRKNNLTKRNDAFLFIYERFAIDSTVHKITIYYWLSISNNNTNLILKRNCDKNRCQKKHKFHEQEKNVLLSIAKRKFTTSI